MYHESRGHEHMKPSLFIYFFAALTEVHFGRLSAVSAYPGISKAVERGRTGDESASLRA